MQLTWFKIEGDKPTLQAPPTQVGLKVSARQNAFVNRAQSFPASTGSFALARLRKIIAPILCTHPATCTKLELQAIMNSESVSPMPFDLSN